MTFSTLLSIYIHITFYKLIGIFYCISNIFISYFCLFWTIWQPHHPSPTCQCKKKHCCQVASLNFLSLYCEYCWLVNKLLERYMITKVTWCESRSRSEGKLFHKTGRSVRYFKTRLVRRSIYGYNKSWACKTIRWEIQIQKKT